MNRKRNTFNTILCLALAQTIPGFNGPTEHGFENIVEKWANAGYQHFLLFSQCFLPYLWDRNHQFCSIKIVVCICFQFKLCNTTPAYNDPEKEGFWKHYGKRRNAGKLPKTEMKSSFGRHLMCRLQMLSISLLDFVVRQRFKTTILERKVLSDEKKKRPRIFEHLLTTSKLWLKF